jgi:DNA-binding IscR family transcriptional regulator
MTPLHIPPRLWHAKGLTLLGRILLAEIARLEQGEDGCQANHQELAAALEVKGEHVARTLDNLKQMRLLTGPDGCYRLTELGAQYWLPDCVPLDTGEVDTAQTWTERNHRPRDKDPPPAFRGTNGPLMRQVTQALQGGYTLPAELFDLLPPEVILATHRGEPCIPMKANKKPLVRWKPYQERLPRPEEYRRWVYLFGKQIAGWARVTGRISNIIVLDDDGGGWLEKWGLAPHVRTKRGGFHWIGEYPGWRVATLNCVTSRALGEAFPKLDIRGDGGYSMICNGPGEYEWLREPVADPLDLLPQHVRRFFGLETPPKPARKAERQSASLPMGGDRVKAEYLVQRAVNAAGSYGRNNAGFWLACQLRDNGYSALECERVGDSYRTSVGHTNTRGEAEEYTAEDWLRSVEEAFRNPPRTPWERKQ